MWDRPDLLNRAANILFAESVDERVISRDMGPVCQILRKDFEDILAMRHARSAEWITEFSL